jgi:cation transport protein ChaC
MALTPELAARAFRVVPEPPPDASFPRMTDAERALLLRRLLAGREAAPVWVFAYGSLIWKPVFEPAEVRRGVAHGWHRAFNLRLEGFRGTPDRPGLMMGLAPGGRARGLLMRLPAADPLPALEDLVRREVPYRAFAPMARWIGVTADDMTDGGALPALVFWAGALPSFTERGLTPETTAKRIARACGYGGSCADYLQQTVAHLEENGIHDRNLWRLQRLVAAELSRADSSPDQSAPAPPAD